ncbi:biotin transporter BioY [Bacillus sp. UMB0893]|uniref:biotin transporter BioY n=1 Tax=Bacillus sp. UMB0893 TaxID=2066053 RepID=UPI000C756BC5|nr:biotin transporter BioY [Bacillus sp. UMB0893]PLR67061.1 BioY family transporter [Bacillus sp. UMB0893]
MKNKLRAYDLALVGMFAALMAIGANLTSFLTVGTVPLSMQPFFCILAGLLLGSRLGALSMTVYALVGIAGAPVFAQFSGGIGVIFGSTGGFILSYIAAAYVVGKIVEASKKPTLPVFFVSSFVGIALIYIIGTTYMYAALNYWLNVDMSYSAAWVVMTWFMVKDVIFTAIGAVIAPRVYNAVHKATNLSKHRVA